MLFLPEILTCFFYKILSLAGDFSLVGAKEQGLNGLFLAEVFEGLSCLVELSGWTCFIAMLVVMSLQSKYNGQLWQILLLRRWGKEEVEDGRWHLVSYIGSFKCFNALTPHTTRVRYKNWKIEQDPFSVKLNNQNARKKIPLLGLGQNLDKTPRLKEPTLSQI